VFDYKPLPLFDDLAARDDAMDQVEQAAGEDFAERAADFVVDYLTEHGASPGEAVTDACKAAGIVPHDDRAFGPVYMRLSRAGRIVKVGTCPRTKGHYTAGGNVWAMVDGGAL
jgi:hypothetical protein